MNSEKYAHVEGLAEIASSLTKPVLVTISTSGVGMCQYCGTGIKWHFYVSDYDGRCFVVGSECIKHLCKYLLLNEADVDKALSYFKEYRELAEKAKFSPEDKIALKDLESKVREAKAKFEKMETAEVEKLKAPQREILFMLTTTARAVGRSLFTDWEQDFVKSLDEQLEFGKRPLSDRQMEIAKKILDKVTNSTPEQIEQFKKDKAQRDAQWEADKKLVYELGIVRASIYDKDFITSLKNWVYGYEDTRNMPLNSTYTVPQFMGRESIATQPKPKMLTEKQRAAALKLRAKYHRQIDDYFREYPGRRDN